MALIPITRRLRSDRKNEIESSKSLTRIAPIGLSNPSQNPRYNLTIFIEAHRRKSIGSCRAMTYQWPLRANDSVDSTWTFGVCHRPLNRSKRSKKIPLRIAGIRSSRNSCPRIITVNVGADTGSIGSASLKPTVTNAMA